MLQSRLKLKKVNVSNSFDPVETLRRRSKLVVYGVTVAIGRLRISLSNKLSSAKFLVCFNFQSASMMLKIGADVIRMSNNLDPGEAPSYSASHPDPSCLHMAL